MDAVQALDFERSFDGLPWYVDSEIDHEELYASLEVGDREQIAMGLAAGRGPTPTNRTLPMLADPREPRRALRARDLKVGQRVLHRAFGLGTVVESRHHDAAAELKVEFDDEGLTTLVV